MRTGGIVRIMVPDLDVIGRGYVAHLDSLLSRDSSHEFAYGYVLLATAILGCLRSRLASRVLHAVTLR